MPFTTESRTVEPKKSLLARMKSKASRLFRGKEANTERQLLLADGTNTKEEDVNPRRHLVDKMEEKYLQSGRRKRQFDDIKLRFFTFVAEKKAQWAEKKKEKAEWHLLTTQNKEKAKVKLQKAQRNAQEKRAKVDRLELKKTIKKRLPLYMATRDILREKREAKAAKQRAFKEREEYKESVKLAKIGWHGPTNVPEQEDYTPEREYLFQKLTEEIDAVRKWNNVAGLEMNAWSTLRSILIEDMQRQLLEVEAAEKQVDKALEKAKMVTKNVEKASFNVEKAMERSAVQKRKYEELSHHVKALTFQHRTIERELDDISAYINLVLIEEVSTM